VKRNGSYLEEIPGTSVLIIGFLYDKYNNNFEGNEFKFKSKGQICYVGDGNSVYQNGNLMFKGKLTGYLNSFVHLYNSINIKQLINFIRN